MRQINELAQRTRNLLPFVEAGDYEGARSALKRPLDSFDPEPIIPLGGTDLPDPEPSPGSFQTWPGQRVVVDPNYKPEPYTGMQSFAPTPGTENTPLHYAPLEDPPDRWSWDNVGSALGKVGGGALTALGAAREYAGGPAFAAASGLLGAEREEILDEQGNPTGRYKRDPGLGDWFGGIGETVKGLVTDPGGTYNRLREADKEYFANPEHSTFENIIGQGATDPLTFIGPGAAKRFIPLDRLGKLGKATAGFLEAPRPAQVGGLFGAGAGGQVGEELDLGGYGTLLAALGGGVAGAGGATAGARALRGAGGVKGALGRALAAEAPTSQVMFGRGAHPEDNAPRRVAPNSAAEPRWSAGEMKVKLSDDGKIAIIEAPDGSSFGKFVQRKDGTWARKDTPYTEAYGRWASLDEAKAEVANPVKVVKQHGRHEVYIGGQYAATVTPYRGASGDQFIVEGPGGSHLGLADTLEQGIRIASLKGAGKRVHPMAKQRFWFHGSRKLDYEAPDPQFGVEGVTQGPGVYMTADPDVALNYGSRHAERGRTFAVEFDGETADLVAPIGPKDPMFPGGPSWDDVRVKVAERMEELVASSGMARRGEGYRPKEYAAARGAADAAIAKLGEPDLMSNTSRNFGKGATRSRAKEAVFDGAGRNGYAYREVLAQLAADAPRSYTTKRFGSPGHEKGLAIVHDVMGDMGIDAVFHHSPGADGEVLIVINGEKARVRADLRGTQAKPGMTLEELKAAAGGDIAGSGPTPLLTTDAQGRPLSDDHRYWSADNNGEPVFADIRRGTDGKWRVYSDEASDEPIWLGGDGTDRSFHSAEGARDALDAFWDLDGGMPASRFYLQGEQGKATDVLRESFGGTPLRATAQASAGALYGATNPEEGESPGTAALKGALSGAVRAAVRAPTAVNAERAVERLPGVPDPQDVANARAKRLQDAGIDPEELAAVFRSEPPTSATSAAATAAVQGAERPTFLGMRGYEVAEVLGMPPKTVRELERLDGLVRAGTANAAERMAYAQATKTAKETYRKINNREPVWVIPANARPALKAGEAEKAALRQKLGLSTDEQAALATPNPHSLRDYLGGPEYDRIKQLEVIASDATVDATRRARAREVMFQEQGVPPPSRGLTARLLDSLAGEVPSAGVVATPALGGAPVEAATFWQKVGREGIAALNLPRSLLASGDLSFALRQGIIVMAHYPKVWAKAWKPMFQAMAREETGRAIMADIEASPRAALKAEHLQYTDWGSRAALTAREEAYMSSWASRIPFVSHTERAYAVFMNKLRSDVFDHVMDNWEAAGKTASERDLKELGERIMAMTGRSDISGLTNAGPLVNAFFFSPRFLASRLKLPMMLLTGNAQTRLEVAKDLVAFTGTGIAVLGLMKLAGVDVGTNPIESDFGKIRAGKRTFDFWAGYGPIARMTAHLITGEAMSSGSGVTSDVNRLEEIGNFLGGKMSPTGSTIFDALRGEVRYGENFSGTPTGIGDKVWAHTAPLFLQDMFSAITGREGPGQAIALGTSRSLGEGLKSAALGGVPGVLGVSTSEYQGPIDDLDNAAENLSAANPERYPDGSVGFWDLRASDREAIKKEYPSEYARYLGGASERAQRTDEIRKEVGTKQQAADDQLLGGAITREDWDKLTDDNKAESRFRIAEVYKDAPPREAKNAADRYYEAINAAKDPATGQVDFKQVDAWVEAQSPEDQEYIEQETGLGGTPLQKLYRKESGAYYDLPVYRGYSADEAREIDDLWLAARSRARSTVDYKMLRALREMAAAGQIDERVYKGARHRVLGFLREDRARDRYVKANPIAAILLRGQGGLQPDEGEILRRALAA